LSRRLRISLAALAGAVALSVVTLAGMIAFGTRDPPPPLTSVVGPFEQVDFRDMPEVETVPARDGSRIAYRRYIAFTKDGPERVVIAIHGSSATSLSNHPFAKAMRAAGISVYVVDVRGHGGTGRRGDLDHAGQLDDDLSDFVAAVRARHPAAKLVLLGFSAGGGYALHAAALPAAEAFERVVLVSPMLGPFAPTTRSGGVDRWASVFMPRIIGLVILDRLGIHAFEHLPTLAFAIDPKRADILTATYSYRLMMDFGTRDYASDLRHAKVPLAVLVGSKDEIFDANKYASTIHAERPDTPVTVVPGLDHVGMLLKPAAFAAEVAAVEGH
jgi:non-heme chloroperoxidase